MANTTVAFNLPSPYQADLDKIAQQQKMAELLQAQSLQPSERYSYKGIEARSPVTAGLAKMLQGFTAMQMQEKGLEEQKALGERYRSDQSADFTNIAKMLSAPAVAGQAEIPARAAEIAPEEMAQSADYGTPLPGAAIPAVPARRAGQIDPEMMGQAKTSEGQQMLMAQLLAQIGPEKLTEVGKGGSLYSPRQGKVVFTAPTEEEFGTTPIHEKSATSPTGYIGYLLSKTGNRKELGPTNPMNQFTTPTVDAAATLTQNRELSDRTFNGLSVYQRKNLENEAARLGISAQQLFYDTGLKGGGGAALPPPGAVLQQVPQVAPQGAAPIPVVPTAAPRPMVPAAAPQPGAMVPQGAAQTAPSKTGALGSTANNSASTQVVSQSLNNRPIPQKLLDLAAAEKLKGTGANENTLRDEYNNLTKDFRVVQDAHEKIKSVAATGAGDMSLLYSFVKLLDPGSVVRESEFAAAAASGSFGERIQGAMQRVISGQRLPDSLRNDFIREADNLYTSQKKGTDRLTASYTGMAKRMGLNPENVIVDYASKAGTAMPPLSSLVEGKTTNFDNGQSWTLQNGKPVQVK